MTDNGHRVLLFPARSLVGRVIGWQTRSSFSHAALLDSRGTLIESREGKGVRELHHQSARSLGAQAFRVEGADDEVWWNAMSFARGQVGARYDYRSVARFLTRSKPRADGKWFCSELVFAALQFGGVDLLARTEASRVSPAMLSLSPLLIPCS